MIKTFKESATEALFVVGDEELLQPYAAEKQVGYFTFIRAIETPLVVKIDGETQTLCPDHIMVLTPLQYLTFVSGNGAVVYQFNREFYCIKDHDREVSCVGLLFYGNELNPVVKLNTGELEKFTLHHAILTEEFDTEDNIQAEMLRMLLKRFIIKTTRLVKSQKEGWETADAKFELLRQYNLLVETHFRTEHQVGFYADQLFKSPKTLSNVFRQFNTSPAQIIRDRIIQAAKRELIYTELSLKEIAFGLGFEEAAHFSRFFKNNVGSSPSAFKQNAIGKN